MIDFITGNRSIFTEVLPATPFFAHSDKSSSDLEDLRREGSYIATFSNVTTYRQVETWKMKKEEKRGRKMGLPTNSILSSSNLHERHVNKREQGIKYKL